MKKMINKTHLEGLLYETSLEIKQSGPTSKNPGANYIRGSIAVQIDDDNVVTNEIMEMEYNAKGKNARYDTAVSIMNAATVLTAGAEAAAKVRIDAALAVNDFYNRSEELVTVVRSEGGFIHLVSQINNPSATFETDMLITSTSDEMERNADGDMVENGNLVVNGYIFNFRNELIPVKFVVENQNGIKYFRDLEQNTFTKVWGNIVTKTTTNTVKEASAFGEDKVVTYTNTRKKFVITGANAEPYEFGEDGVLTVEEMQKAVADRNTMLQTIKTRSQTQSNTPQTASVANNDTKKFNF